jgi:hypothetical protein
MENPKPSHYKKTIKRAKPKDKTSLVSVERALDAALAKRGKTKKRSLNF